MYALSLLSRTTKNKRLKREKRKEEMKTCERGRKQAVTSVRIPSMLIRVGWVVENAALRSPQRIDHGAE